MPMSRTVLVLRAVRKARAGRGPDESKIYEDNADLLVPNALHRLATQVARDAERRPYLTKTFSLTATSGVIDISSNTDLLRDMLVWASFYDYDDTAQKEPYIFKWSWNEIDRWQNPVFGYFARKNETIITRQRAVGDIEASKLGLSGTITLIASYVPDLSATFLPEQLEDDAVAVLAEMAMEGAATG